MRHEVSCGHRICGISASAIRGCYYGYVNYAVHGVDLAKVCNHVLVHHVVIDTVFG